MSDDHPREVQMMDRIVEIMAEYGIGSGIKPYIAGSFDHDYSGRGWYGKTTELAFVGTPAAHVGDVYIAMGIGICDETLPVEAVNCFRERDDYGNGWVIFGGELPE